MSTNYYSRLALVLPISDGEFEKLERQSVVQDEHFDINDALDDFKLEHKSYVGIITPFSMEAEDSFELPDSNSLALFYSEGNKLLKEFSERLDAPTKAIFDKFLERKTTLTVFTDWY